MFTISFGRISRWKAGRDEALRTTQLVVFAPTSVRLLGRIHGTAVRELSGASMTSPGRTPKFSDREIAAMRERRAAGEKLYAIAVDYGASEATIRRICRDVIKPPTVVGPHGLTPYMRERLKVPSHRWSHMRSYRSRDYAIGVCSVFAAQFPQLDWTVCGSALWMREPLVKRLVIAAQEGS